MTLGEKQVGEAFLKPPQAYKHTSGGMALNVLRHSTGGGLSNWDDGENEMETN
jgi:hypothetical protein